jgi:Xaa-Pro aminopeptidase
MAASMLAAAEPINPSLTLLSRLSAPLQGDVDFLLVRDITNVVYYSRFNPYCTSHGVDLVVFPDGTSVLFVEYIRRWAKQEELLKKLSPGLKVVVYPQQLDESLPSTFQKALYKYLRERQDFSKYWQAFDMLLESRTGDEIDVVCSLKIGLDLEHISGSKAEEVRTGFPRANFIDVARHVEESKLVLDDYYVNNQMIAAELVQVVYCTVVRAIRQGFTKTKACDAAHAALQAYKEVFFPDIRVAGIGSRDGLNFNGWDFTLVSGSELGSRETKPEPVKDGEPWTLYIVGYVNQVCAELIYTGGENLSADHIEARNVAVGTYENTSEWFEPGVLCSDIYLKSKAHLAEYGFAIASYRGGHSINNPFHGAASLKANDQTKVYVGSAIAYEPIIAGKQGKPHVKVNIGQTCIMMDHGLQPLNSFSPNPTPISKEWKINGVKVEKPNLARAAAWILDFDKFRELCSLDPAYSRE